MANVVIVPIGPGSDGNSNHRPQGDGFTLADPPTNYLEKIGTQWQKSRGSFVPGTRYLLDRLPAGYAVYGRPRKNQPKHTDYYLYGHPAGKAFDSTNRFFPHFEYLMDHGGDSTGCTCTVCVAKGGTPRSMGVKKGPSLSRSKGPSLPKGRPTAKTPGTDTSRVDEEGTPDVYRNFIDKLKRQTKVDEPIIEPMSLDWRAEQQCLDKQKTELSKAPPHLPRAGEIVLFVRELEEGVIITREPRSGALKLYTSQPKPRWLGFPEWEAGVVGQTPAEETCIEDLVAEPTEPDDKKQWNVSYSGVRVEPIPDPNSDDKSLSKQYKYVPLRHTRPFVFWAEFLHGIPEDKWHPTIQNALTAMATFSVVNRWHFRGIWPKAKIYCYGVNIGPELVVCGDTVRLLPKSKEETCTDILVIRAINLQLTNLDLASDNDYDDGRPYQWELRVVGTAFTTDQSRSSKEWLSMENTAPEIAQEYKAVYPLHPPGQEMNYSFSRIMGRLYDANAMVLWRLSDQNLEDNVSPTDLDPGREGTITARAFARANDKRIADRDWYWGETRADALDLETMNGLEVSKYDTMRDPQHMRSMIRVLDELEVEQRIEELKTPGPRSLKGSMAPPSSLLGRAAQRSSPMSPGPRRSQGFGKSLTSSPQSGRGSPSSHTSKRKANKVIDLSDDEEDDIGRLSMAGGDTPGQRKRPKVAVGVVV